MEFSARRARFRGLTAGVEGDWAVSHSVWVTWTEVLRSTQVTEYHAPGSGPPGGKPPSLFKVRYVYVQVHGLPVEPPPPVVVPPDDPDTHRSRSPNRRPPRRCRLRCHHRSPRHRRRHRRERNRGLMLPPGRAWLMTASVANVIPLRIRRSRRPVGISARGLAVPVVVQSVRSLTGVCGWGT